MASEPRSPARRLLLALGCLLALVGTATLLVGAFPDWQRTSRLAALGAPFVPYGALVWLAAGAIVVTAARRWWKLLAILAAGGMAVHLVWAAPYLTGRGQSAASPSAESLTAESLTVMTINVRYGTADMAALVAAVESADPDVVVLVEITTDSREALRALEWDEMFPNHVGEPAPAWDSSGTMVFSTFPLELLGTAQSIQQQHTIRVEGPAGPLVMMAVHPINPWVDFDHWATELEDIRVEAEAHTGEPLIALGDFNAVREHLPMRRLLDAGLTEAAEQAGAGWLRTFPADRVIPPLIAIDHVLVNRHLRVVSVTTFSVAGSDHLGLVASIEPTGS